MATQPGFRKKLSSSFPIGEDQDRAVWGPFFDDIPLDLARAQLRELYRGWVLSERNSNCDPDLRKDLLFLSERLDALLEAGAGQCQRKKKPNK
jgi:hypothetical protein